MTKAMLLSNIGMAIARQIAKLIRLMRATLFGKPKLQSLIIIIIVIIMAMMTTMIIQSSFTTELA
jgi:hypothetical protein